MARSWRGEHKRRHHCPGFEILERHADTSADHQRRIDAVQEPADQPNVALLIERDVDEDNRKVTLETGQERLSEHNPGADGTVPADGLECKRWVVVVASRADHVGRMAELLASAAAGDDQRPVSGGRPIRGRDLVGHRNRARRHEMTAASLSAMISSQP
jgi:hypothetical protein